VPVLTAATTIQCVGVRDLGSRTCRDGEGDAAVAPQLAQSRVGPGRRALIAAADGPSRRWVACERDRDHGQAVGAEGFGPAGGRFSRHRLLHPAPARCGPIGGVLAVNS